MASTPPMLRQCATTAITAVRAASIMFAMAAMLGRLVAQLKMPRLDAYAVHAGLSTTYRFASASPRGRPVFTPPFLQVCDVIRRKQMPAGKAQVLSPRPWQSREQLCVLLCCRVLVAVAG